VKALRRSSSRPEKTLARTDWRYCAVLPPRRWPASYHLARLAPRSSGLAGRGAIKSAASVLDRPGQTLGKACGEWAATAQSECGAGLGFGFRPRTMATRMNTAHLSITIFLNQS
jgi:hypothetical protein